MCMVFRQMRESISDDSPLFGNEMGQDMFWDMMSFEVGRQAPSKGPGIANLLYREIGPTI